MIPILARKRRFWTPAQIPGVSIYLDAAAPGSLFATSALAAPVSNGEACGGWKGIVGGPAVQDTAGLKPLVDAAGIGGTPGLLYDADDALTVTGDGTLREMTYIWVMKSPNNDIVSLFSHGAGAGAFSTGYASTHKPLVYMSGNNFRIWDAPAGMTDGLSHVWELYIAGVTLADINNAALYVDGIPAAISSTNVGTGSLTAWGNLVLKAPGRTLGAFVAVIGAVSATDRARYVAWARRTHGGVG